MRCRPANRPEMGPCDTRAGSAGGEHAPTSAFFEWTATLDVYVAKKSFHSFSPLNYETAIGSLGMTSGSGYVLHDNQAYTPDIVRELRCSCLAPRPSLV